MGIRFSCPNGHKLNVKSFLAGKRAICPQCGTRVTVPSLPDSDDAPGSVRVEQDRATTDLGADEISTGIASQPPSVILPLEPLQPAVPEAAVVTSIPSVEPAVTLVAEAPLLGQAVSDVASSSYQLQRTRRQRNQVRIAIALLVMVVLLATVLFWVLTQGASSPPSSAPATKAVSQFMSPIHRSPHWLRIV